MFTSSTNGAGVALGIAVILVAIAAYWVPTIVVPGRHAPNVGLVVVVNLLLGWTFIGWIVALVMALKPLPQPYPPPYQPPYPPQYGRGTSSTP